MNARLKKWLPRVIIAIWAPLLLVFCAFLLIGHWVTLPLPSGDDPKLAVAIDNSRDFGQLGQWYAVHVLYSKCTCSERIVKHIFNSERPADVQERIILVEEHPEWQALAKARGIPLEVITREELNSIYNIPAAPIMVVADPLGTVRYAGGYTARKKGPDIRDVAIINDLMQEHPVDQIPLFGCAVAKSLSKVMDPFGVKTWSL